MGLASPLALGLGLLGLAILALHLLRPRRRERKVSSTLPWRLLAAEAGADSAERRRRLRPGLLLALQLATLATLVLALARPWRSLPVAVAPHLLLLVDRSLTMAARDGAPSRLDAARAAALERVAAAPEAAVTLIAFDREAELLLAQSRDPLRLRAALEALEPRPVPGDAGEALRLAEALAAGAPEARVLIVSDGAFALDGAALAGLPIELLSVGRSDDNQAVVALELAREAEGSRLFVRVANAASRPARRRVETRVDGLLFDLRELELPPGGQVSFDLALDPAAREVETRLAGADALPLDDRAWALARGPSRARVALVTPGNRFLATALDLMPEVEAWAARTPESLGLAGEAPGGDANESSGGADADPGTGPGTDADAAEHAALEARWQAALETEAGPATVLLLDGLAPPDAPPASLLLIAPPLAFGQDEARVRPLGRLTSPRPRRIDPAEPLLTGTDFESVQVDEALALELGAAWRPLVEAEVEGRRWPLMAEGWLGGRPALLLAFDLRASDLPLRPAFPLWLAAAVARLTPQGPAGLPERLAPGSPLALALPGDTRALWLTDPDGQRHELPVAGGRAAFADTWQPGIYRVERMGETETERGGFVVSLAGGRAASIRPRELPAELRARPASGSDENASVEASRAAASGAGPAPEGSAGDAASSSDAAPAEPPVTLGRQPLWPLMATLALALLLAEWAWDHRRAAGRLWRGRRSARGWTGTGEGGA